MLSIGSILLESPLILAPLAGYSDLPFRLLCRHFGAGLCVSEMISSHGLAYGQSKTISMLDSCAEERPVSFQLFGADPDIMAEAAAILSSRCPDVIDINMGCPVKKVTKRGAGAALMTDLPLAEKIVKAVVEKCPCPVTVKIRSGPDSAHICALDFSLMAEDNGAAAVAVHGRTWKQQFSGEADWQIVADVKREVKIPVFGNGDVKNHAEAIIRMHQTGCDAVLIGRAAIGNPWVFSEKGRPASLSAVVKVVRAHLELIDSHFDEPNRCLGSIKNHLGKYFKNFPGSAKARKEIYQQADFTVLSSYLHRIG
ncbi:MAG: tRNA dihydrouridine synthase DusB [Desulfofustis sp.]|nr:tRNA dihydrouridine synthase DusB [Desulfofustis sp.]